MRRAMAWFTPVCRTLVDSRLLRRVASRLVQHVILRGSAVVLLLSASRLAAAQPAAAVRAPEAVWVDFVAPDTCATSQAFYTAIRSRTALFKPTSTKEERGFDVSIRDEGETFVGTLVVHATGGSSERRELRTHSCEEILETFALIVAVAIDPNARLSPAPKSPEPPKAEPPPVETVQKPPPAVPAQPAPAAPPPPPGHAAQSRTWRVHGALGATGAVSLYVAPFAQLGAGTSRERPGELGYEMRLSLVRTLPVKVVDGQDRQVSYALTTVRPELGGNLTSASGKWVVGAGLGADLGVVNLDATQVSAGSDSSSAWVAMLATSTVRWLATPLVAAELQVGGQVPLIRNRYRLVDPEAFVEKPSPFGAFMSLGIAVRIW